MNPKEEEVTIITEVSPRGMGVCVHCAPVTCAGPAAGRYRSPAARRRCYLALVEKGAGAVGTAALQELKGPLLSALTLFGQRHEF